MLKKLIYLLIFTCLCLALPGCGEDETLADVATPKMHNLTFTVQKPQIEPMTRQIGQTKMDLDGVNNYSILLYKLKDGAESSENSNWELYQVINGELSQSGGNGSSITETTQSFSTTAYVESGEYLAFAVANLPGDIGGNQYNGYDISTVAGLKQLPFEWDDENKKVMFGTFYKADDATFDKNGFNGNVTNLDNSIDKDIRKKGMAQVNPTEYPKDNGAISFKIDKEHLQAHLTTKLYPMAALVTVYFDTFNLDPNVHIKVNSISLKNIPKTCYLWSNNQPGEADGWMDDDHFYPDYTKDANGHGYNGDTYLKHVADPSGKYTHNTYDYGAIFFLYENRQGTSETVTLADKKAEGNFEYATYVEVDATHYDGDPDNGTPTKTNLIYRYAIGEDAPAYVEDYKFGESILYNNYNVTRNRHYKVYLTFKGTGKEGADENSWKVQVSTLSATPSFTYDYTGKVSNGTVTLVKSSDGTTVSTDSWTITGDISSWGTLDKTAGNGDITFSYTPNDNLKAGTYTGQVVIRFSNNNIDYTCPITLSYTKHSISEVMYSYGEEVNSATWTEDLSLNSFAGNNKAWLRLKTTPNAAFHNLEIASPQIDGQDVYTIDATSSPQYADGVCTADNNGYIFLPLTLTDKAYSNGLYATTVSATDLETKSIELIRSAWTVDGVVASCHFNGSTTAHTVLNTQLADSAANTFATKTDGVSFGRDGADNTAPSMLIYDDLSYGDGVKAEDTYLIKSTGSYISVKVEEGQQLVVAYLGRYNHDKNLYIYNQEDFSTVTPVTQASANRSAGPQILYTPVLAAGTYYITSETEVFFYYVAVKEYVQATFGDVIQYSTDNTEWHNVLMNGNTMDGNNSSLTSDNLYWAAGSDLYLRVAIPDGVSADNVNATYGTKIPGDSGYATFQIGASIGTWPIKFTSNDVTSATVNVVVNAADVYEMYALPESNMVLYKNGTAVGEVTDNSSVGDVLANSKGMTNFDTNVTGTIDGKTVRALKVGSGQEIWLNVSYPMNLTYYWHNRATAGTTMYQGYIKVQKVDSISSKSGTEITSGMSNTTVQTEMTSTKLKLENSGYYYINRAGSEQRFYYLKLEPYVGH